MRDYLVPFVVGFLLCGLLFMGLDLAVMKMQGLSLIYSP